MTHGGDNLHKAQEDEQEAADEAEDVDETEDAEEEIYA